MPSWSGWTGQDDTATLLGQAGEIFTSNKKGSQVDRLNGFSTQRSVVFGRGLTQVVTHGLRDISVWSLKSFALLENREFVDPIRSFDSSPDGTKLAVSFSDGSATHMGVEGLEPRTWCVDSDVHRIKWLSNKSVVADVGGNLSLLSARNFEDEIAYIDDAHDGYAIHAIARVSDEKFITSGEDGTVRAWNNNLRLIDIYESPNGEFCVGLSTATLLKRHYFAMIDERADVHVFSLSSRRLVTSFPSGADADPATFAGFSPSGNEFGITHRGGRAMKVWRTAALVRKSEKKTLQYRNAKVVLVGDTGVGKSGLALPLTGRAFSPTESTHGRRIWTMLREVVDRGDGTEELREILLWDLAGQPGYRLFHRLSLRDAAIGIVLFDAKNEADPFRGIKYWSKAVDSAADSAVDTVKFLVAARSDVGGLRASNERIETVLESGGYQAFYETSAKTGRGVARLADAIRSAVVWDTLPAVIAPEAFVSIREYLISYKENTRQLICTVSELMIMFRAETSVTVEPTIFEVCIQRLETAGLISRIAVGDRWLLQPELMDSYAAWLSQAARREPDGLGALLESQALNGDYEHEKRSAAADEDIMCITAVQEVVGRGLALRINTEQGQMLVFPSELRTDLPDYPSGFDLEISITFAGPVAAVYASTAVRLINSLLYRSNYKLYKNAALFSSRARNGDFYTCGFAAHYPSSDDDAHGRVVIFFGGSVPLDRKLIFARYVDFQLQQMAVPGSLHRERLYHCCGLQISSDVVAARSAKGLSTVMCPVCGNLQPMDDLAEDASRIDKATRRMQSDAISEQDRQQRATVVPARERAADYDIFLSYNSQDRAHALSLRNKLREYGFTVWYDVDELTGGTKPAREIERVIDTMPIALVLFGANSIGPWQEQEYHVFLDRSVARRSSQRPLLLIPVMIPGGGRIDELPPFARTFEAVDLTDGFNSDNFQSLVRAVLSGLSDVRLEARGVKI